MGRGCVLRSGWARANHEEGPLQPAGSTLMAEWDGSPLQPRDQLACFSALFSCCMCHNSRDTRGFFPSTHHWASNFHSPLVLAGILVVIWPAAPPCCPALPCLAGLHSSGRQTQQPGPRPLCAPGLGPLGSTGRCPIPGSLRILGIRGSRASSGCWGGRAQHSRSCGASSQELTEGGRWGCLWKVHQAHTKMGSNGAGISAPRGKVS